MLETTGATCSIPEQEHTLPSIYEVLVGTWVHVRLLCKRVLDQRRILINLWLCDYGIVSIVYLLFWWDNVSINHSLIIAFSCYLKCDGFIQGGGGHSSNFHSSNGRNFFRALMFLSGWVSLSSFFSLLWSCCLQTLGPPPKSQPLSEWWLDFPPVTIPSPTNLLLVCFSADVLSHEVEFISNWGH